MFKFMEDQSFEREVQSTCSVLFNELLYACTTSELPQFSVCVCVGVGEKQDAGPFPAEEDRIPSQCRPFLGSEGEREKEGEVAVGNRKRRKTFFRPPFEC